ncbi:hypothetical protein Plec18167_008807 [Paecilomyces lecythidis]|uniref:Uncharacterized protein n=1 Tax=Paecilomyces lecythidis TaxID=3004212 RepID=A0ABR3WTM0_9EURO
MTTSDLLETGNETGSDYHLNSLPLYHHSLITANFEQLTFHAAAFLQLKLACQFYGAATTDDKLIVSPYNTLPHLLDLKRYDHATQLFSKALTIFKPIREDYAVADYEESFNFAEVFALLKQLAKIEGHTWQKRDFYVVTFRSQLKPNANSDRLFELDSHSHAEATESGGLLKYWYGSKNDELRNLATCFWQSRDDAYAGGKGPWHAKARAAADTWYQSIVFRTYALTIDNNIEGWKFTPYDKF